MPRSAAPIATPGPELPLRLLLAATVAVAALSLRPAAGQTPEAPAAAEVPAAEGQVRLGAGATLLPPVSTTALRNRRQLFDTPATVNVIPGTELDQQMVRSAEDVFRYTPGVFVNRQTSGTDPFGSIGGITIRGVGANRVLTLVDGFRTIERITDQTRDVVDPWNLSRVEVVRGPGSVLYGSDALGGVVNYITRNPEDYIRPGEIFGGEVSTSYGSLDRSFVHRGTVAGRADNISLMFSYQRRDAHEQERSRSRSPDGIWNCTRNPQAIPCDRLNPADIGSNDYFARFVWDMTPEMRLRLTANVLDRTTDVDYRQDLGPATGGITNLSWQRRQQIDRTQLTADWEWRPALGWLDEIRVMAGYIPQTIERSGTRLRRLANGQQTRITDRSEYSEDVWQGEIQLRSGFAALGVRHVLTYGVAASTTATDFSREDVTTNLTTRAVTTTRGGGFNFANADTRRLDAFLQDEMTLFDDRLTIIPGLRFSNTRIAPRPDGDYRPVRGFEPRTLDESNVSFGIGAIWRFNEQWSAYANYGEGFKMPTAEQLFTSVPTIGSTLIPNPNLNPEQVRSYEAGIRLQLPNAYLSLGAFRADYTDFIQSFVAVPGLAGTFTYQNLSEVRVQGIELGGAWRIDPNWLLQGALSWQEGTQRASPTAQRTAFDGARPLNATLGITWEQPEWRTRVTLNGTYAAEVNDLSSSQLYRPKSYEVFDLIASWRPLPNLELNAGIFNLLNRRYVPLPPGGTPYSQSQFTSNDVKATNPIELQVAAGINIRVGMRVTF